MDIVDDILPRLSQYQSVHRRVDRFRRLYSLQRAQKRARTCRLYVQFSRSTGIVVHTTLPAHGAGLSIVHFLGLDIEMPLRLGEIFVRWVDESPADSRVAGGDLSGFVRGYRA